MIMNIAEYFNYDLFTFWFPHETITYTDGTHFPINPPATYTEERKLT